MDPARASALFADFRIPTRRLLLRRLGPGDGPTLLSHEADRRIMRWIRDPESETARRERVGKLVGDYTGAVGEWLAVGITIPPVDRAVGLVCAKLSRVDDTAMEIGYRLEAGVHRQGIGREAVGAMLDWLFDVFGARRISAVCVPENEASWRLMERLGMVREARIRDAVFLDGAWRDELIYGLLARERSARPSG
ncbi:MAG: GNAT family N-acetyltransferase [Planctomycetota bacterium]